MATLFMSGLGKLFGVTVAPGSSADPPRLQACRCNTSKEDSVVMDQSWSRLFILSDANSCQRLRWTKQWLRSPWTDWACFTEHRVPGHLVSFGMRGVTSLKAILTSHEGVAFTFFNFAGR